MRNLLVRTGTAAFAAGLVFALAGCGASDDAVDGPAIDEIDGNLMFEAPANDASAMESVVDMDAPEPGGNAAEEANTTDTLGETSGGDTGGNTVESNVSGM